MRAIFCAVAVFAEVFDSVRAGMETEPRRGPWSRTESPTPLLRPQTPIGVVGSWSGMIPHRAIDPLRGSACKKGDTAAVSPCQFAHFTLARSG